MESENTFRVLAMDIGFGTTDVFIYDSHLSIENCPRLVVPSRTQLVAAEIMKANRAGLAVAMQGVTMGGGPCSSARKNIWGKDCHLLPAPKPHLPSTTIRTR